MAAALEAIASRLEAAGLGVRPTTGAAINNGVYVGRMPQTATHGILVYPRPTGGRVDNSTPGYIRTRGRIVCRGDDYSEVMVRAHAAAKAINLLAHSEDIFGVIFIELYASTTPVDYPLSEGTFIEISFAFRAAYVTDGDWVPG